MGLATKDEDSRVRFLGLYRAEIVEIDYGVKLNRVRLKVPEVLGDVISNWATLAAPLFGGSFSPDMRVGDRVVVFFSGGDPDRPVCTHQWAAAPQGVSEIPEAAQGVEHDATSFPRGYGSTSFVDADGETVEIQEPTPAFATSYPNSSVLRLPSGIQIELDSSDARSRIQVWHPAGSYYEIRPDGSTSSKSTGSSFSAVEGNKTDVIRGSAFQAVSGVSTMRAGQGMEIQADQGPLRMVTENGDMTIVSKDNRTATIDGVDSVECGGYSLSSNGVVEMFSGDGMVLASKQLDQFIMGRRQEVVGNAFAETISSARVVISGNDLLQFSGIGSRQVILPQGNYEISIVSGVYSVTVNSGSGVISIPTGPFSINTQSTLINSALVDVQATSAMTVNTPSLTMIGSLSVLLQGNSAVSVVSNGAITLSAPTVAVGINLTVAGELAIGAGTSQAVKGNELLAYITTLVNTFNSHTHVDPQGGVTAPPSTPMVPPDSSLLSALLRLI